MCPGVAEKRLKTLFKAGPRSKKEKRLLANNQNNTRTRVNNRTLQLSRRGWRGRRFRQPVCLPVLDDPPVGGVSRPLLLEVPVPGDPLAVALVIEGPLGTVTLSFRPRGGDAKRLLCASALCPRKVQPRKKSTDKWIGPEPNQNMACPKGYRPKGPSGKLDPCSKAQKKYRCENRPKKLPIKEKKGWEEEKTTKVKG